MLGEYQKPWTAVVFDMPQRYSFLNPPELAIEGDTTMSQLAIELEQHRRGLAREVMFDTAYRQVHLDCLRIIAGRLISGSY